MVAARALFGGHGAHRAEASMPERQTCGEDRVVHETLARGALHRQLGVVGEADDGVTSAERAAARRLITVPIGIASVLAASA
jgi:hypothetical protein